MTPWIAVAVALDEPGDDDMGSRLSTYLHPLAGRPLLWHTLSVLAGSAVPPSRILVVGPGLNPDLFQDLPIVPQLLSAPRGEGLSDLLRAALAGDESHALLVDGAVPCCAGYPEQLVGSTAESLVVGSDGYPALAWLNVESVPEAIRIWGEPVRGDRPSVVSGRAPVRDPELFHVRNRSTLSLALIRVRDRVVDRLMQGGVTFMLPSTVTIDIDVQIGRDSVIYPGVVIEGNTRIGEETVIGPSCRIIDSWVGSGVELKGWNYVAHTSIRNRAILEPYVRRGYD